MNTAKIEPIRRITAQFKELRVISGDSRPYEGEYEVTPKVGSQTELPTRGKVMLDDVTVLEIPIYEVSNESGNTLIIG